MKEYYEEKRKMLERAIDDFLQNYVFKDYVEEIVKGGKRLRGVLCLLTCESLGGKAENALDAAVAIELIHSASLTHDDIIDQDKQRRNKPAFWIEHGIVKAIMIPHMLVSHAFHTLKKYGIEAMKIASLLWSRVVEGEMYDIMARPPYEQIVVLKTGGLFAIATSLGAIAAAKENLVDKCRLYGEKLGMAYQIADDMYDCLNMKFEPSTPIFLSYLGLSIGPQNITKLAIEFSNRAREKLEQAVVEAEKVAEELEAEKMKEFVRFAVNELLRGG